MVRLVVGNLDERGHRNLVHLIWIRRRINGSTASPTVSDLAITALHAFALIQAYVHGAAELHVRGLRKLERSKLGAEEVSVHRVEIVEKIRIDGATRKWSNKFVSTHHCTAEKNAGNTNPLKMIVSSCDLVSVTCI